MWPIVIISSVLISVTNAVKTKPIDQQKVVAAHNEYRKNLKIPPLKFSKECADFAQSWANHLASKNRGLSHSSTEKYGENCYWYSGKADEQMMVMAWGKEEKYFNHKKRTYTHGSGHYSQIIWKNTKFVGAGMAIAKDGSEYWVCTYYPAGNYLGEKAY